MASFLTSIILIDSKIGASRGIMNSIGVQDTILPEYIFSFCVFDDDDDDGSRMLFRKSLQ